VLPTLGFLSAVAAIEVVLVLADVLAVLGLLGECPLLLLDRLAWVSSRVEDVRFSSTEEGRRCVVEAMVMEVEAAPFMTGEGEEGRGRGQRRGRGRGRKGRGAAPAGGGGVSQWSGQKQQQKAAAPAGGGGVSQWLGQKQQQKAAVQYLSSRREWYPLTQNSRCHPREVPGFGRKWVTQNGRKGNEELTRRRL